MNKIIDQKTLNKIIDNLKNSEFDFALEKIKNLSHKFNDNYTINKLFATTYFKKMDWLNAIKYYKKIILYEKEKYKILTNIGVAYFKLGKINKSITLYKKSIIDNPNSEMTYNNLALSYIEIGLYEKAYDIFLIMLKINKQNSSTTKNIIFLLNFVDPKNIKDNSFSEINKKIKELISRVQLQNFSTIESLKTILNESDNIINKYSDDLVYEETQIYRKNSKDLNCKRHFKIFNTHNIIPKFCFSCYKVQVNLKNVVDLIRLHFIFDNIDLENNNIRKCIIELRNNVNGNYKGYVYCTVINEADKVKKKLNKIIMNENLKNYKIDIKHGCTEFYKSYPKFKKINFNGDQEFLYNKSWKEIENFTDKSEPERSKLDQKIWIKSMQGVNLADILIIKNWINYAKLIGDDSYKKIYNKKLNNNFINNLLRNQLSFRKNEFNQNN